MDRQNSPHGPSPLLVVKIMPHRGPLHGYGIGAHIQAMSDDLLHVEQGSLYQALHRMEEGGWIRAKWIKTENKRRARLYEITGAGRKQLAREEARWSMVTAAVGQILQRA